MGDMLLPMLIWQVAGSRSMTLAAGEKNVVSSSQTAPSDVLAEHTGNSGEAMVTIIIFDL